MDTKKYYTLNVRATWKHYYLERQIKGLEDPSHDMTRSALLERQLASAKNVENWNSIQPLVQQLKKKETSEISEKVITNLQVKYTGESRQKIQAIKEKMKDDLNNNDIGARLSYIQMPYFLLMLEMNYLEELKRKIAQKEENNTDTGFCITLPDTAALLTEMLISEPTCKQLRDIQEILISWKKTL